MPTLLGYPQRSYRTERGPRLALELAKRLGLDAFLERVMPPGRERVPWSLTALILVVARLCGPSSELHIAEHFYRQTALPDLLGVSNERGDDNRSSRGLDAKLPHQPALEAFLRQQFGELFAIEYDLLLYDVTSAYFEGQAEGNPLAKRGNSRDHRPDCKQVCIGLVVTRCGLPLGYEVFVGNRQGRASRTPARAGQQFRPARTSGAPVPCLRCGLVSCCTRLAPRVC